MPRQLDFSLRDMDIQKFASKSVGIHHRTKTVHHRRNGFRVESAIETDRRGQAMNMELGPCAIEREVRNDALDARLLLSRKHSSLLG